jgi:hypothetical protein
VAGPSSPNSTGTEVVIKRAQIKSQIFDIVYEHIADNIGYPEAHTITDAITKSLDDYLFNDAGIHVDSSTD